MDTADLTDPVYYDEVAARAYFEAQRWPYGPICPHCGAADKATRLAGKTHRPGLLECRACRRQSSVTVGTVFERSHIPLHKWVLAAHLLTASKNGMSANRLHRMLAVNYGTARSMAHRIRQAMTETKVSPICGEGEIVEVNEIYFSRFSIVDENSDQAVNRDVVLRRMLATPKPSNVAPDADRRRGLQGSRGCPGGH